LDNDEASRVRPKLQIPAVSASRRRIDESRDLRGPDTGNDVTRTPQQPRRPLRSQLATSSRPATACDGHDTGLGSICSLDDNCSDDDADNYEQRQLNASSLSNTSTGRHDLTANEQDMEICRRRLALIDGEMERQIEARFRETMANITGDVQRNTSQRNTSHCKDNFDIESVQTEDIEHEFCKTLIDLDILPPPAMPPPIKDIELPCSKPPALNTSRRSVSIGSNDNDTDELDNSSVRTEDFEVHFHRTSTGVKHIAHTAVPTFDPFMVDSDLETVRSQLVRDSFQTALARNDQMNGSRVSVRPSSGFQRKAATQRRKREASPSSDAEADIDEMKEPTRSAVTLNNDIEKWKRALLQHHPVTTDSRPMPSTPSRPASSPARIPFAARQPLSLNNSMSKTANAKLGAAASKLAMDNKADYELSCRLRQELAKVQSQLRQALQSKQAVQQTNDRLQSLASQHQMDIMSTEKQLKDSRAMAESARSELALMELKRDAARRELESLTAEVDNRRLQLQRLAVNEKNAAADEQLSMSETRSNADAAEAAEERHRLELTVDELKQQIKKLTSENADFKQHADQLRMDLERSQKEMSEASRVGQENERSLKTKLAELESSVKRVEQDKQEFMQRKTEEFEANRRTFTASWRRVGRDLHARSQN